jgi:hypothetical protein
MAELEGELKTLTTKHQSALRLIGEVWTRNQALINTGAIDRLNITH